jgi:hypothetical protein
MSGLREFLERPQVLIALGTIFLLVAIASFVSGGRGIFTGVVLTLAGGNSVWRGFTKRQAQHR